MEHSDDSLHARRARLKTTPEALGDYMRTVAVDGQTPEALAEMILEDINDQVIPCWLDVTLRHDGAVTHEIRIEDRQPRWDDKGLLTRLGP